MRVRVSALALVAAATAAAALSCGRAGFEPDGAAGSATTPPLSGTPTSTATPTPVPSGANTPPPGWFPGYAHRAAISFVPLPALPNYSVSLTFDHAGLVTSAQSLALGTDVRVVREAADHSTTEADRILGPGSSWNTAATTLWFRVPTVPVAGEQWWLYWGNPNAFAAPANPDKVYLFQDDFESGNLNKWQTDQAGVFNPSTAKAHGGTHSVVVTNQNNKNHWLSEQTGLGTDLRMDGWWYATDPGNDDIAQGFRSGPAAAFRDYETNLHGGGGLDIAEYIAAGSKFNEFQGTGGNTPANTWFHVTTTLIGTKMQVYINESGAALTGQTATRNHAVNNDYASGGASLRSFTIKNNQFWYVDDVVLRAYQEPEPALTLGPPQSP